MLLARLRDYLPIGGVEAVPPDLSGNRPPLGAWASLSMSCESRRRYRVILCDALLQPESPLLRDAIGERNCLLVTTPTVARLYGPAIRAMMKKTNAIGSLILPACEETKSMNLVETVCDQAISQGLDRRGILIGFGGGVCLDVVTLSASLIRRGIGHLRIPTTLIGQIDAGIGLKGAVNFRGKKSFIGCFHPPEQVLIDPSFLRSLNARFISSGIAEAIKMGLARDPLLFDLVETAAPKLVASGFAEPRAHGREILRMSIGAMLEELRRNPYEDKGYERVVDFGHTFSPALEAAQSFNIHHGEAVAVDMALSAAIARCLGLIHRDLFDRIVVLLRAASLPVFAPKLNVELCLEALKESGRHRGGSINLVVPAGIGRTVFLKRAEDVPRSILSEALRILRRHALGDS